MVCVIRKRAAEQGTSGSEGLENCDSPEEEQIFPVEQFCSEVKMSMTKDKGHKRTMKKTFSPTRIAEK